MRTYGRPVLTRLPDGSPVYGPWTIVQTGANGENDHVYLTALAQVLLLNLGESPFYNAWGIPAAYSVISQLFPDLNVTLTQQRFAPHFSSLLIGRLPDAPPRYTIQALTHAGVRLDRAVPIPI